MGPPILGEPRTSYYHGGRHVYETDLPAPPGYAVIALPEHLRPIYDGDEPATWEALKDIWQPVKTNA